MIVGWRVSSVDERRPDPGCAGAGALGPKVKGALIHHSDNGSQYLIVRYTERLAEAGIEASVGSVGDAYDNALAETDERALQGRGHLEAGPLEKSEMVERRNARMGPLVQCRAPARADRLHPPCGV